MAARSPSAAAPRRARRCHQDASPCRWAGRRSRPRRTAWTTIRAMRPAATMPSAMGAQSGTVGPPLAAAAVLGAGVAVEVLPGSDPLP